MRVCRISVLDRQELLTMSRTEKPHSSETVFAELILKMLDQVLRGICRAFHPCLWRGSPIVERLKRHTTVHKFRAASGAFEGSKTS